jgi:tetratricopeptide (TPR) repeat protein
MRFVVIAIILFINFVGINVGQAWAANAEADKTESSRIVLSETDEFRRLRLDGFEAVYNMDYDHARVKFEQMAKMLPDHPAGNFYLATNLWLSMLNSSRRLQANLYNNDSSFYSDSKDKVDEKEDQEFRRLVNDAIELADAALKKNAKDTEALYYLGAAHGLLASYEGTVTRAFLSALRNGAKSVEIHKKVVEMEPDYTDAYLTIGAYDYIVGSLPTPVKLLIAIGGVHGSRNRGLEELQAVSERGLYAKDDARVLLITLFAREKRYDDELKLLETLSAKYPRNYIFRIERAATLIKLDRSKESNQIFEELLKDKTAQTVADQAHFQYGEALLAQNQPAEALKHFQAISALENASTELVTRAHLRAGQILDLLSRRNEAIGEYQTVLKRDNVFDSHEQAKKYLQKPYVMPAGIN